jgi:RND family efflux transporter MFP subunit
MTSMITSNASRGQRPAVSVEQRMPRPPKQLRTSLEGAHAFFRFGGRSGRRSTGLRLAALVAVATFLGACSKTEDPAPRTTVNASVVTVQRASMPTLHAVAGTVHAETASTLAANVVGTIAKVNVAEGDRVRKGDVLVQIEARDLRANADRAGAGRAEIERAIDAAAANAQLAEATFRRFDSLRQRGSASAQEYDEARSRHTAAQAEVARLTARRSEVRAAVSQAQAVLDYTSIRAPIDGVVTARFVDPGAQAAPGVPLLTIENATATRVDASVPEHVTVRAGDTAFIEVNGTRTEARVTRVQPSVDAGSRSALVKLQLDQPIRAGTYVKVLFPVGARESVTVPAAALVQRGQLTSVFVVGTDSVARMRLITVGARDAANAEVLSGLDAGESIVTDPSAVKDGVVVRRSA